MARIKQVLWERRMAWLQAKAILAAEMAQDATDTNAIARLGRKPEKSPRVVRRQTRKDKRATSWTII